MVSSTKFCWFGFGRAKNSADQRTAARTLGTSIDPRIPEELQPQAYFSTWECQTCNPIAIPAQDKGHVVGIGKSPTATDLSLDVRSEVVLRERERRHGENTAPPRNVFLLTQANVFMSMRT